MQSAGGKLRALQVVEVIGQHVIKRLVILQRIHHRDTAGQQQHRVVDAKTDQRRHLAAAQHRMAVLGGVLLGPIGAGQRIFPAGLEQNARVAKAIRAPGDAPFARCSQPHQAVFPFEEARNHLDDRRRRTGSGDALQQLLGVGDAQKQAFDLHPMQRAVAHARLRVKHGLRAKQCAAGFAKITARPCSAIRALPQQPGPRHIAPGIRAIQHAFDHALRHPERHQALHRALGIARMLLRIRALHQVEEVIDLDIQRAQVMGDLRVVVAHHGFGRTLLLQRLPQHIGVEAVDCRDHVDTMALAAQVAPQHVHAQVRPGDMPQVQPAVRGRRDGHQEEGLRGDSGHLFNPSKQ